MNCTPILIAALAGACAPALAHADADLTQPLRMTVASGVGDDTGGQAGTAHGHFDSALPVRVKGVKNAPYSAEIISEEQHTLADGNQIVNKRNTMSYRDSAGRTRHEIRDAGGTLRRVTINDAVQGTMYVLNPEAKLATKIGGHGHRGRPHRNHAPNQIGERTEDGGERIIVKRIARAGVGEASDQRHENVRIHVRKQMAGLGMAGFDRIGPAIAGAFGDMKWASRASVKNLGTREMEGVKAQGKLKTYEIPAGAIGNRNAIMVASESWYAPDMQVTLMTKRSDPRTGERTWRMANIKREEPAAALFAVPSDYTLKDLTALTNKVEKMD